MKYVWAMICWAISHILRWLIAVWDFMIRYMFDYQVPAVQSFKSSSKNFIQQKLIQRKCDCHLLTHNRVLKLSRRILNKHYVRTNIDQISICSRWGRKLNVRGKQSSSSSLTVCNIQQFSIIAMLRAKQKTKIKSKMYKHGKHEKLSL